MAAVYEARYWRTRVAVKSCTAPTCACRPPGTFHPRGYAANRVQHPDVVTILDHGELEDGTPYFVMDLLEGCSLEQHLARAGTLEADAVLWLADRVLDVLVMAHHVGVIHRDIKPGNIFLTRDGCAKVLDFGLARLLDGTHSRTLTRTGTVIGTAAYMSPSRRCASPTSSIRSPTCGR